MHGESRTPAGVASFLRKAASERVAACSDIRRVCGIHPILSGLGVALMVRAAWSGAFRPVLAEMGNREVAVLAQNPLPHLVVVPFMNNFNFGYGPERGVQDGLNIQPLIPISVTPDVNIIFNPALGRDFGAVSRLGDVQVIPFILPATPGPWVWGVGPPSFSFRRTATRPSATTISAWGRLWRRCI